jgi:UDP-N-acetylmuramoyl-tripeptide--D-alanyl-D-alanine ligase
LSAPLWTAGELAAAAHGTLGGAADTPIAAIAMDSRAVRPGDAFFAIRGERLDGHDFVAEALAKGAALAVVAAGFGGAAGLLLTVDEPLAAMERVGAAARARSSAKVIAVTGSVGKTGTKEALRLALAPSGEVHASPASFNNKWGVPFTLANLPPRARFAVIELGMNHAGEIAPLSALVRPHVAIVTTVEAVHIGNLGSLGAIADAKAEIFAGIEPDGIAILNRDNAQFERLAAAARGAGARVVPFGEDPRAEARLVRAAAHDDCSTVEADICGVPVAYRLGSPGRHLVLNSLAVLAAAKAVGADLALAALALAELSPPRGRGGRLEVPVGEGTALVMDESYNANPASMRAALALLGAAQPGRQGRRIAVLGDMLELGRFAKRLHRGLKQPIAAADVDLVFACGPKMGALWAELPDRVRGGYAADSGALVDKVANALRPGDVVMVKGSLGSRMGALVAELVDRAGAGPGRGD